MAYLKLTELPALLRWTFHPRIVYRGAMLSAPIYQRLRANGDVFVAFSLVGCLVLRNWTLTVIVIYYASIALFSGLSSIWQSIVKYNFDFFKTNTGIYYNIKLFSVFPVFLLIQYHGDGLGGMETPLKSLAVAYVIALNIDHVRWHVFLRGAALGAIVALVVGLLQIDFDFHNYRSGGATNPIRYGMIAMALGSVCAVGLLRPNGDRITMVLSAIGLLAGIGAAFASGSRGALLVLPFIMILLAPVLWQRSKAAFITVAVAFSLFVGALLLANVGQMSTRIGTAYDNISAVLAGGEGATDGSVGVRTKLLVLAYQLFESAPILGVGKHGWDEAINERYDVSDPVNKFVIPFNQAHNQYLDDLAKGGIVRFLVGFLILFAPIYLFFRCEPYSDRPGSQFALAGVVVSVAFMIFCLSESLMILSISSVVHAVLIFSLLVACDAARSTAPPAG